MFKLLAIGLVVFPLTVSAGLNKNFELRDHRGYLEIRNGTYECESQSGRDDGLKKEKIPVGLYVEKIKDNELFFTVNLDNGIHLTSPELSKSPSKSADFVVYSRVTNNKEKSIWSLQSTEKSGVEGMVIKTGGGSEMAMVIKNCQLIRNLE
ncbi:hypothetical protein U3C50_003218 [Providencia rettgeri]|nr:hypothetical protein [Providencia rettgeri]